MGQEAKIIEIVLRACCHEISLDFDHGNSLDSGHEIGLDSGCDGLIMNSPCLIMEMVLILVRR